MKFIKTKNYYNSKNRHLIIKRLDNRQFFIAALGAAVLLRLLLMPFFAHVDLYSEYRRVFYVLQNGLFLENSYRYVTFNIELIFAAFSQIFINVTDGLFHLSDPANSTASLTDYHFFLNDPNVYRHLFFFKLPYLIFDIATAVVIWKFIDKPEHKRIALLLWLFNPVTIFATYIFGRFEVFGLFFLAMTALQLKNDRLLFASVMFGLALLCREINLLFAPFLLLSQIDFKDHYLRNGIMLGISSITITLIYLLPNNVLSALGGNPNLFSGPDAAQQTEPIKKLLSLGYYWFYPVVVCLATLAIYTWETGKRSHAERFVIASSITLFIYFAFNSHSVHYSAWLVLFPILSIQYGRRVVLPFLLFFGAWLALWLLKTDGGVFTAFLAAPLSSEFVGMGHFPTFFMAHIASEDLSLHQAIQLTKSLFAVVMGFFAYRLIAHRARSQ